MRRYSPDGSGKEGRSLHAKGTVCAKTWVHTVVLHNLETQVGQGGRRGGCSVEDPVREGAGRPRHVFFKPA